MPHGDMSAKQGVGIRAHQEHQVGSGKVLVRKALAGVSNTRFRYMTMAQKADRVPLTTACKRQRHNDLPLWCWRHGVGV